MYTIRARPQALGHKNVKICIFFKMSLKKEILAFCDLGPQVLWHKKAIFLKLIFLKSLKNNPDIQMFFSEQIEKVLP